MRLVRLLVPAEQREAVLTALREEDIDFVTTTAEGDGEGRLVEFPLPAEAVGPVLETVRATGLDEEYTVVVPARTAETTNFEALRERFVEGDAEDNSVASEELRDEARRLTPNAVTYYAMTLLSALVATAGLLLDSPAVVVGSMVIAPQVGSALTASLGAALNDRRMAVDGAVTQVAGLACAVLGAAAFGWLLRTTSVVPFVLDIATVSQIQARISPGLLSLVVGLCAGAAGAFGLATAVPVSLVGVMIAAALIPAAAATGIGIAWGYPAVAYGAALLLVVNTVSINVAGLATFWYLDYRPDGWTRGRLRPNLGREQVGTVAAVVIVALVAFAGAGSFLATQVGFEQQVNAAVGDTLDDDAYDRLELAAVTASIDGTPGTTGTPTVTVEVLRPADRSYPGLAAALRGSIEARSGESVAVDVRFVERQRVGG